MKPRERLRAVKQRQRWAILSVDKLRDELAKLATRIDDVGNLIATDRADMLACYASNVLQGSQSLLRELKEEAMLLVEVPRAPRRATRGAKKGKR